MADAAQIQQLLSNLQSQLATVQSLAGQMTVPVLQQPAYQSVPNYPT
jgi:hypothetical protein